MLNVKAPGIYRLDFPNGYFYVGQAVNICKRWRTHRSSFKGGYLVRHQPKLSNVWTKHGDPTLRVLVQCEPDELDKVEQFFIDSHWGDPKFCNTHPRAESSRGVKRTHTPWQLGKKFTEKHRQNLSKSAKGRKANNSKLTDEQVREIRAKYSHQVKGQGSTAIAQEYGISYRTVLYIIKGERYSHVI